MSGRRAAENTNTTPNDYVRLVPMSREQVESITSALSYAPGGEDLLNALFAAWDAASADPESIIAHAVGTVLLPVSEGGTVSLNDKIRIVDAVTTALGYPDAAGLRRQDNPTP